MGLHKSIRLIAGLILYYLANEAHSEIKLTQGELHQAYFPENLSALPPKLPLTAIPGDKLPIPILVSSQKKDRIHFSASIHSKDSNSSKINQAPLVNYYLAKPVHVEGNSNGACTCPAGQIAETSNDNSILCVTISTPYTESEVPDRCPTNQQRLLTQTRLVRTAPFDILDPLIPLGENSLEVQGDRTELIVAVVSVPEKLPYGPLTLDLLASTGFEQAHLQVPLRTTTFNLAGFPELDVSYWLSEDPRDLIERPVNKNINDSWGGDWWSDEHWHNLENASRLQSDLGVTNVLVPLFVRNPFHTASKSLVGIRCITGTRDVPNTSDNQSDDNQNDPLSKWKFDFQWENFQRYVGIFKRSGFRYFEGAHLIGAGDNLPNFMECDLFENMSDAKPYHKGYRFLPRPAPEDNQLKDVRLDFYQKEFLPVFLDQLSTQLDNAGIREHWLQHVIDENISSESAFNSYMKYTSIVRNHLRGIRTLDAINQYTAPRYTNTIDIPVVHLALLYDDQMPHKNIRTQVFNAFENNRRYFYDTALRNGGPNRFLDGNSLEERLYGWLSLELNYQGMLYWAANRFRYPQTKTGSLIQRKDDWSPYHYSIGPLPNGTTSPGYGPGANWNLYPTQDGLAPSLRAFRLRDGLLDHWLYKKAEIKCHANTECLSRLENIVKQLTRNSLIISDIQSNPETYNTTRINLLDILN